MKFLQSVRARHSVPQMAQEILPKELPNFYPILFKSVSICFKMFHICCFALPARINVVNSIYKIVIVPSTTLPMTNNLSFQSVLGGAPKSVKGSFVDYVVSFRHGQTRAQGSAVNVGMRWIDPRIADAYPSITIYHHHIIFTQLFHTS